MIKTYIHIGYPKTATTTLQEGVLYNLHNEGKINYLGILGFTGDTQIKYRYDVARPLIRGLEHPNISSIPLSEEVLQKSKIFDASSFIKQNLDITKNFLSSDVPNVLSDESMLIPNTSLYGYFDKIKRLKKIYPSDSYEIIVTLRAHKTLIPSYYAEKYPYLYHLDGYETPEKAYYDNGRLSENEFLTIFNFYDLAMKLEDEFGKENIHFVLYENLKNDSNYYSDVFNNIFKIESGKSGKEKNQGENYRVKNKGVKGAYLVKTRRKRKRPALWLLKALDKFEITRRLFHKFIYQTIEVPIFSEKLSSDLFNYFREYNIKLANRYNLDIEAMREYGYL